MELVYQIKFRTRKQACAAIN
nr:hypothetical protein [Paenibacillus sp. PL91]